MGYRWGINITLSSLPWTFIGLKAKPGGAEVSPHLEADWRGCPGLGDVGRRHETPGSETENYDDSDASR